MSDHGVVLDPTSICFTRILPASVDEVWAFLTESGKAGPLAGLRRHGSARGRRRHAAFRPRRPVLGGGTRARGLQAYENGVTTQGVITRCEPPRLLAFTWGGSPGHPSEVTFELSPQEQARASS